MPAEQPPAARRPLKTRSTPWASGLASTLLRLGARPNQVSLASIAFALAALACFLYPHPSPTTWLLAALGIQLRLLCNLMDGMLAVEGGLRSPDGDLFNEFPDRLADTIILVGLGYAGGSTPSALLGWAAACAALMAASTRLHGASLTGSHDFRGPMAKPHRMALATALCLLMALPPVATAPFPLVTIGLAAMLAGTALTIARRLSSLSRCLRDARGHASPPPPSP